ncbi:hypothetical protein Q7P37_009613 [Cladosporium fusiforme]
MASGSFVSRAGSLSPTGHPRCDPSTEPATVDATAIMAPTSMSSSSNSNQGGSPTQASAATRVFNITELVERIFMHASPASVFRGKAICKFINNSISNSPSITYKMANLVLFDEASKSFNVHIAGCVFRARQEEAEDGKTAYNLYITVNPKDKKWSISHFDKYPKLLALQLSSVPRRVAHGLIVYTYRYFVCFHYLGYKQRGQDSYFTFRAGVSTTFGELLQRTPYRDCDQSCPDHPNSRFEWCVEFTVVIR